MATKKQDRHIAALKRKAIRLEAHADALRDLVDEAYEAYETANRVYHDTLYEAYPEKRPPPDPLMEAIRREWDTPGFDSFTTFMRKPIGDLFLPGDDEATTLEWEQSDNFTGLQSYR
jgi:hypothetical protein